MGVNGEALQLHAVHKSCIFHYKSRENPYQYYKSCKNPYQYYKSCKNLYQVLQVMQESVSVLQVMHAVYEHAMKSKVYMIMKIIITTVPSYTGKISLVCCRWHCYLCCALVTIHTATNS